MDEDIIVPLAGMFTGIVMLGMVVLGPVGRSIGEVIRHWLGGGSSHGELPAVVDDLAARVEDLSHQVREVAERQDFAERLLSRGRHDRALPGAEDEAGRL